MCVCGGDGGFLKYLDCFSSSADENEPFPLGAEKTRNAVGVINSN